jgi:hypothetical protein
MALPRDGVSSSNHSDGALFDLDRDMPTTAEDVRMLRILRRQTPGWLDLTPEQIEAMVPEDALKLRAVASPTRRPFSLE